MPQIVRIGDICTGHGCWPPRPCISGSSTVFMNGIGAHRGGDRWATHCKPCGKRRGCHGAVLKNGSGSVFVNSRKLGRVGDGVSCGSRCAKGSPTTFCGG